ncbi:MAG: Ca-activated chloride channel [Solirubrobacteraceae bacterium]|jgi:Ca-activated chloride channel family protein|nr:Ca-activated chloride channel [Solirubrobacteraceae bacterium]
MTFREPVLLAGLLILPIAVLAYLALQRRRGREATAFSTPGLLPNLVTARPGMRRHVPPLLLLFALAALIVALARPQHTVAAAQRAATVMMVTDTSGSMNATDVEPDRLSAAQSAARKLADQLPQPLRLGLVSFSDAPQLDVPPTTDRDAVRAGIDRLQAEGGTAMGLGLERALEIARTPVPNQNGTGTQRLPAVLLLLSDGKDTVGGISPIQVAERAKQYGIPIYTVALGTPGGEVQVQDQFGFTQRLRVPPDPETLRQIAQTSGGRAFTAADQSRLESIYANLGTKLSSKPEEREVTAAFAGGALVLVLVGSGLSLAWFGRLV